MATISHVLKVDAATIRGRHLLHLSTLCVATIQYFNRVEEQVSLTMLVCLASCSV